ncbi:hypothetical protein N7539_002165 [Penicillium diatomitis]|uniref:Carbohydrate kinase PfkB domain-containing protein n=1 Tax=Penicillium diatomitis TaxID=2819901 RepID=A0A9X0C0X2_9EURO|nr:uncharacterized protein N7539_002165 [Penicillium diatomitis]KAJ5493419.1 hypothetical protein N7539_002165 [Penicillium diatomitis]
MLVAIGACYFDTVLTTSHYPAEDEKLRASSVTRRRGGNCPNTLEVLGQLVSEDDIEHEFPLELITVLPARSSQASQRIISEFSPRVGLENCVYREDHKEPASCYIIRSKATGSRTIVNYNNLPEATQEELIERIDLLSPRASWFHFEGRMPDLTLKSIRYIRKHLPATKISVEMERPGRPGLQALAQEADVVFYARSWALGAGHSTAEECLHAEAALTPTASLLCCTSGEEGASALQPSDGTFAHAPAHTTENFQVVDPIGAGDTFIAGMLYSLARRDPDWDLTQKLAFANRLAGTKVSQEGFSGLYRVLASIV